MNDFVGTWTLVASAFSWSETLPDSEAENRAALAAHLLGADPRGDLDPASGMTLTVYADGRFMQAEDGTFEGEAFDAEGVLTSNGLAFAGRLVALGARGYLQADARPSWAAPAGQWLEPLLLRLDDGDTIISEWVVRDGDDLVRTISVVTDQAYPSRATLRYSLVAG